MNKKLPTFITGEGQDFHNIIFGPSGKGESIIIQQMADQQGNTIPKKKMERLSQPTETQIEQLSRLASQKRLQMIRDAYWNGSEESEFCGLHDSIVDLLDIDPTMEQVRAVFNLLPSCILGGAIQWGMNDTVIREQSYVFIQNNAQLVRKELS